MPKDHCRSCRDDSHCCIFKKQGFAFIGIKDAEKIRQTINKEFTDFIELKKLNAKDIRALKNDDPSLEGYLRYTQLNDGKILSLKTKKNGHCIFLNSERKCEIYEIRPNICRMFPHWMIRLKDGKSKLVTHDEKNHCNYARKRLYEKELKELEGFFKRIETESIDYKRNIKKFIQRL